MDSGAAHRRRILQLVLNMAVPLAGWGFLFLAGPRLIGFFMPFVIGGVIALIANPLVSFLENHLRIVRRHSSIVIVVLVLGLVIGLLYLAGSRLVWGIQSLLEALPGIYEGFREKLLENSSRGALLSFLPPSLQEYYQKIAAHLGDGLGFLLQKAASPTVEAAGTVAKGIPAALVYTVVIILSSYFFIVYRDMFSAWYDRYLPEGGKCYFSYMKEQAGHLITGYFMAQFKIMAVVWGVLVLGFWVLGIPFSPVVAFLVAFLDFLPVFGTGTVLIPWAFLKVLSGEYYMALGLALLYVLTQVIRQLIQPKLVGDSMGLNPFGTLFLLYLGFKIKGLAGMILAVPVGLLFLNLYEFGAFEPIIRSGKELMAEINHFRKEEKT